MVNASSSVLTALVVDDETAAAKMLGEFLALKGFNAVVAGGGREGLAAFSAREIDLVVTDLRMPDFNGNDLIGAIREIDQTVPIVVLTGYAAAGERQHAVHDGASFVVKKPVSLPKLLLCLSELVSSSVSSNH